MIASSYPLLDVFWTMLEFFLFFLWIYLVIMVIGDVFRSHDIGGLGKAVWVISLIVLPYLGVFIYLIARGRGMHERALNAPRGQLSSFDQYRRERTRTDSSTSEELARLASLRDDGKISEGDFQKAKDKILG